MAFDCLSGLPTELLVELLSQLCLADLSVCKRVCQRLHEIIKHSLVLRYNIELEIEGFRDVNEFLPIDERMRRLEAYRRFWREGDYSFVETFTSRRMEFMPWAQSSTVLAFMLSDSEVAFRQIPSRIFDVPPKQWTLPPFPFRVISIALDQAQQLLVVLQAPTEDDLNITMHFLHSETGIQHPKAAVSFVRFPVVAADDLYNARSYQMQICSHMVCVSFRAQITRKMALHVLNWENGMLIMNVLGINPEFAFVHQRYIIWQHLLEGHAVVLVLDSLHPLPLGIDLFDRETIASQNVLVMMLPEPPEDHIRMPTEAIAKIPSHTAFPATTLPPFARTDSDNVLVLHFQYLCRNFGPLFCPHSLWLVIRERDFLHAITAASERVGVGEAPLCPIPWREWSKCTRIFERPGFQTPNAVHGSRLFVEDFLFALPPEDAAFSAIHDFRELPLRRDPSLINGPDRGRVRDGVVQHLSYQQITSPLLRRKRFEPNNIPIDFLLSAGEYFIVTNTIPLSENATHTVCRVHSV